MAPGEREKTTFSCHEGLSWFTRTQLGLKSAPGTIQQANDIIMSTVRCKYVLVYLADIIVYSTFTSDHLAHVQDVRSLF